MRNIGNIVAIGPQDMDSDDTRPWSCSATDRYFAMAHWILLVGRVRRAFGRVV